MKVKDAHMQAFPFIEPEQDDNIKAYHPGMTMRDYFAAKAMQSFATTDRMLWSNERMAAEAYDVADAMLKARKK